MRGMEERTAKGQAIAAVIVPCASRKRSPVAPVLRASALPVGHQARLEGMWATRLSSAASSGIARDIYMGRGFGLGRDAAERAGARLFIVSAGLGLIDGARAIPSYGLTVAGRDGDSIVSRVKGRFDAAAWWSSVQAGPFSTAWKEVFDERGLILMAMSQGYATLIAADLANLEERDLSRLRLFGIGLEDVLPVSVAGQVMPYDDRLDAILPGTRTDFAQRALSHFTASAAIGAGTLEASEGVRAAIAGIEAPHRPARPRATDDELVGAIRRHLRTTKGIGRILSRLRHEDSVACEQRRFTRLYRIAEQLEVVR